MSENNVITKVYDLSVTGGDKSYKTLQGINQLFIEIKNNKQALGSFDLNIDTSKLSQVSKEFAAIAIANKDLVASIKASTTEISKFGQVGSQMTSVIVQSFEKAKGSTLDLAMNFAKVSNAVSGSASSTNDYITIIGQLVQKHTLLMAEIGKTESQISRYEREIKSTEGTMAEYGVAMKNNQDLQNKFSAIITENTEKIALLKVELSQLRAQASEVGGAVGTMNKVNNSALLTEESEALARNKVELSENNMQLRQNAKLALAAAGSMDALAVSLGVMKDRYRALSEAERESSSGQIMLKNIQGMDDQIKKLDATIGNSQRKVGEYGSAFEGVGSKILQFVVRDLFRAAAGFIVFTALFEGAQKVWEEATTKEFEFAQATDALSESLKGLNDIIEKLNTNEQTLIENEIKLSNAGKYYTTSEDLKQRLDLIKAIGVQDGEVYIFEKDRLDATLELGKREIEQLEKKKKGVTELSQVMEAAKVASGQAEGGIGNQMLGTFLPHKANADAQSEAASSVIENSLLDRQVKDKILSELNKSIKDGVNVYNALEDAAKKYGIDAIDIQKQIAAKQNELSNQQVAFDAEVKQLEYSKNIELYTQLMQLKEQFREINEKQDIASVDKIVGDTKAKYALLIATTQRQAAELAKHFPGDKLPAALQDKYDAIIENFRMQQGADQKNQTEEYLKQSSFEALQHGSNEANSSALLSKGMSDHGIPDYDAMVDSLNKETIAKKDALQVQFENEKTAYIKNGDDITNLQNQQDEKLKEIDAEAYRVRLTLASEYFKRLSQSTIDSTNIIIENIDTETERALTKIYSGDGSNAKKEKRADHVKQHDIIKKAQATIDENTSLLPDANDAVARSSDAVSNATTPDEKKEANDQYNSSVSTQGDIINKIEKSKREIAQAQSTLDEGNKKLTDKMISESLNAFQQIGESYLKMLSQQDAARERHAQVSLDWNKKEQDSQAQSNQQKMKNDKAYFMAQQELEKQKFANQKKLQEQTLTLNFATATMKLFATADDFEIAMVEEAALAAIYGAQLSMIASAQYGAGGDVPNNGGVFGGRSHANGGTPFLFAGGRFEAEAQELAIINKNSANSNRVLTLTGTPKQIASGINAFGGGHDFAPGAMMHKSDLPFTLGSQIQPPSFISDSASSKAMADFHTVQTSKNSAEMYSMIMANNKSIQDQAAALHNRIDNLQVSLDHRKVTAAQNDLAKTVKVGTIGGR